jgi:hypothetical protein
MARYILKDYASAIDEDEDPVVKVFKNKDDMIQQLLSWLGGDVTLEVKK